MHHIMFDIDGTLVQSSEVDSTCFVDAVQEVTGMTMAPDWASYQHVTDAGILDEFLEKHHIQDKPDKTAQVKNIFITRLRNSMKVKPVTEIPGARNFLNMLQKRDDITISCATGGWLESALLKLDSAGIPINGIAIASSDDHFDRIRIMQHAKALSGDRRSKTCTYFGDGIWDKRACEVLKFRFIAVGNNVKHTYSINDFKNITYIFNVLGLQ